MASGSVVKGVCGGGCTKNELEGKAGVESGALVEGAEDTLLLMEEGWACKGGKREDGVYEVAPAWLERVRASSMPLE